MNTLASIARPETVEITIVEQDGYDWNPDLDYYLAGPMSGYPEYNYPEFEAACKLLRANGIKVSSPHEVAYPESKTLGDLPYQKYMDGGLALLKRCDGIILLSGWPQSTGALLELAEATQRSLPVHFLHYSYDLHNDVQLVSMNRTPKK